MQFERRFADGIRAGAVTLTFRRWRRPQVVAGRRYRLPMRGFVEITAIETVDATGIDVRDALRAGFASVEELETYLAGSPATGSTALYRIELSYCGDEAIDPRAELAGSIANDDESTALTKRLDAMDRRSPLGPWTRPFLRAIASRPGVRAAELATALDWDVPTFKTHVRKLKALGLTESLEVGYRLSPRGAAFLRGAS